MSDATVIDIGGAIAAHRRWFMLLGVVLVIAGILSIVFPFIGGLAVEVWTAVMLLIVGGAQIAHAFAARQWQGFLFSLVIGLIYVAAGAMLWLYPVRGVVALTVLLAAVIFADGVITTILSFQIRGVGGWLMMLVSGILGIVVGLLLWRQLPASAAWALGLMLGLNLIFSGIAFVSLANAAQPATGGPHAPHAA